MQRLTTRAKTIGWIDAREPGFVARVLDRIASEPDGLTRRELRDLFPANYRNAVAEALRLLIDRKQVAEVTRVHGFGSSEQDHRRLMTLKDEGRVS